MNQPESDKKFTPRQAIAPTPQLYDELVGDGMEKMAKISLEKIPAIPAGAVLHDNGCGTGAGTAAIVDIVSDAPVEMSIMGTDINEQALAVYKKNTADKSWPAEAARMDSAKLSFPDDTFTHSLGNSLIFVLPNDGIDAVKETYRTLKPGGIAILNSWAVLPNMGPIQAAAKATRPEGTPLPRQGLDKWSDSEFLRSVVEKGGFDVDKIRVVTGNVPIATSEATRYANMLWSFIGGTGAEGWLESDEQNWDRAIAIVLEELRKTDGFRELDGGRLELKFVANIAIATK